MGSPTLFLQLTSASFGKPSEICSGTLIVTCFYNETYFTKLLTAPLSAPEWNKGERGGDGNILRYCTVGRYSAKGGI
jgi:hypothetical protein